MSPKAFVVILFAVLTSHICGQESKMLEKYHEADSLRFVNLEQSKKVASELLKYPRDPSTDSLRGAVLKLNGILNCMDGDIPLGVTYFKMAKNLFHELGSSEAEADAVFNIAAANSISGELDTAAVYFLHSLDVCNPCGDKSLESMVSLHLAHIMWQFGDLDEAEKYSKKVVDLKVSDGDALISYIVLGEIATEHGDIEQRKNYLRKGLEIADKESFPLEYAQILLSLAGTEEDDEKKRDYLKEAELMYSQQMDGHSYGLSAKYIGCSYLEIGDTLSALSAFNQGIELCEKYGNELEKSAIELRLAEYFYSLGDLTRSKKIAESSVLVLLNGASFLNADKAYALLEKIYQDSGDDSAAEKTRVDRATVKKNRKIAREHRATLVRDMAEISQKKDTTEKSSEKAFGMNPFWTMLLVVAGLILILWLVAGRRKQESGTS